MSPAGPDTDAGRELLDAATGRPWELIETSTIYMNGQSAFSVRMEGQMGIRAGITALQPDAEVMIAAVNMLPGLLDEIDRLRERLRQHVADLATLTAARDALAGEVKALREENERLRTWATELAATAGVCPHCGDDGPDHTGCGPIPAAENGANK